MDLNQELLEYLAAGDLRRARQVEDTLAALTPREALLVREAAVIGYVNGQQDAKAGHFDVPRDSDIVHMSVLGAISANGSNPNHFKLIAAAAEGRRPRVRKEEQ